MGWNLCVGHLSVKLYYIAEITEVGLLSPPFDPEPIPIDDSRRLWMDSGLALNRYTGHEVLLTVGTGWGEGIFGTAIFGWS